MGADFIIAVNVTPDMAGRLRGTNLKRVEAHKQPNIFQVLLQSVYITTYSLSQAAFATADVGIEPDLGIINLGDFNQAREAITIGRKAGEAAIPDIGKSWPNCRSEG
jgi:predicted acylesterase/phospholipase RssA